MGRVNGSYPDFRRHPGCPGDKKFGFLFRKNEYSHDRIRQRFLNCHLHEVKNYFDCVIFHLDGITTLLYVEIGVSVPQKCEVTENVVVFI